MPEVDETDLCNDVTITIWIEWCVGIVRGGLVLR